MDNCDWLLKSGNKMYRVNWSSTAATSLKMSGIYQFTEPIQSSSGVNPQHQQVL